LVLFKKISFFCDNKAKGYSVQLLGTYKKKFIRIFFPRAIVERFLKGFWRDILNINALFNNLLYFFKEAIFFIKNMLGLFYSNI